MTSQNRRRSGHPCSYSPKRRSDCSRRIDPIRRIYGLAAAFHISRQDEYISTVARVDDVPRKPLQRRMAAGTGNSFRGHHSTYPPPSRTPSCRSGSALSPDFRPKAFPSPPASAIYASAYVSPSAGGRAASGTETQGERRDNARRRGCDVKNAIWGIGRPRC